jgi:two-component system sensor histidine kinase YesM
MSAPYFFLIVPGLQYKQQYDAIIENITTANSINNDNGSVKQQIDAEMWAIIAGKKPFTQGNQYTILDDVGMRVQQMIENTESQKGKLKLQVIQRTLQTLRQLVDQVGVQIAANKTFDDNMALMAQIRIVSQLVEDNVQGYALFEVSHTQQQYLAMQSSLSRWGLGCLAAIVAAVLFSIAASWRISKGIYVPIKKLHDVTTTLAREDLEVLVTADNADEITELGISFNRMVGRVRELLAAKISEQEHLKKAELRALQAQINPHFLYNTLDTIIWMAESNQKAQVIALVRALSRFFRITLSKGRDWITVREEVEHIESYLTIQKMRYHDILDYKIDMQADISMVQILKLTLQPLVENALYHGIKNKRSGGVIAVRGRRIGADQLLIEVEDNGIGMAPEKLAQLRASLDREESRALVIENGYGINNVNQRIKLYYGQEYGVTIESERGRGTRVALVIPIHTVPTHYPLPMSAGY